MSYLCIVVRERTKALPPRYTMATAKENFRQLAMERAEQAKGTPEAEWYENEDWFDRLWEFATEHRWWNENGTMWDDIIDEWEDTPAY